jgi:hypothetical protein
MNKIAIASFAVLILSSSAALAQPYGYGRPYGYANHYVSSQQACRNPDRAYDLQQFRTGHMENVPVCLGDPATGKHVTREEYLALYPWSDINTWVYNPAMDVWADNTPGKDYLFARGPANTQNDPRYSQNYSPNYRYNYSQDYRYRRYRN